MSQFTRRLYAEWLRRNGGAAAGQPFGGPAASTRGNRGMGGVPPMGTQRLRAGDATPRGALPRSPVVSPARPDDKGGPV